MAQPQELAHMARITLAEGLQALQSSPTVPEKLMDVAEPIAQTMGMLHHIERTGEASVEMANMALDNVRTALDRLQGLDTMHPAVDAAMEAVAGSLSKLFALARAIPSSPPPAYQGPQAAAAQPANQQAPLPGYQQGQPGQPAPQQAYQPAQPGQSPFGQTVPIQDNPAAAFPPPPPAGFDQTVPIEDPAAVAAAMAAPAQGTQGPVERVPGQTEAPVPPTGAPHVEVELGAHSGSNFFKGLSGNDVIDHGGIFVATYNRPKIGTAVALRLLLPGDLEFEADAIVQWTRETRSGESEPGFGAKFTRISQEGRQLVYRYVRNREPMFYDDM